MRKNRKWGQAETELIVKMWRDGAGLMEIALTLSAGLRPGTSKNDVGARIQNLRSLGVDLPSRRGTVDVEALNKL